ncbi:MAG TPA: site-2 protease family protein [Actinomycetota bacterium]|jgi:Zn-dependent protease|nr:site-2 protease family protein [Actinomycetota bacterium]
MGSPLFWLRDDPQLFAAFVVAVILAITFHEFSHAAVASLQGDQTARSQGRLTLNPLSHLDPLGSIALILAGFGWGRPVPVTPSRLRYQRLGHVLVGLAGPAANFVLALVSVIALRIAFQPAELTLDVNFTLRLLDTLVVVNVVLGVFNLLPIQPLDGSTLLTIWLPPSRQNIVRFLDQYGIFLLLALLFLAPNLLTPIFRSITEAIYGLVGLSVG